MATGATVEEAKKERQRSPNYPAVGLREAVERVRKLIQADGKAGAPPDIVAKHIGYSSAHGQAMSVVAALKKFGLVAEAGGRLAPTQIAMEIVNLPESDSRRRKALRDAALSPALYKQLVEDHQLRGLPSPDVLEAELTTYKGFNPRAVKGFVSDFMDTLEFAGITVGEEVESKQDGKSATVKPGDFVQWVSQGMEHFPEMKRVVGLSEDGKFAFVEGEKTGFPVGELEVGEAPAKHPTPLANATARTLVRRQQAEGEREMRQDVFSLDNGREVTITWPVPLTADMITDIKDWLKIVERKIARSASESENKEAAQ
ncbi:MAG: hypothetical protein QJR10_04075 [Bacillota bacterium]|nr:hypothetical protein [Bacillota bacterium]